jgi:hypothetical protein
MNVFVHRLFQMRPCKPRNPLLRLACGLAGVMVLLVLVVLGLFVGLGMLLFTAARRMLRPAPAATGMRVIEGEYAVVTPRTVSLPRT